MKLSVVMLLVVAGAWNTGCESCARVDTLSERGIHALGPARRIAENPFLIVIGWYLRLLLLLVRQRLVIISQIIRCIFFLASSWWFVRRH